MKKFLFIASCIVFPFLSLKSQVNLKNGLVAHYTLDGHAVDSSGNGLNGNIVGATSDVSRFGKPNTALRFYGNSEAVLIPHSNLLNLTADKSISAWYKIESTIGLTYYPIIIYKPGISAYPTFGLFLHEDPAYGSTQHKVSFIQGFGTSVNKENVTTQDYRNYVNQWVHIVATCNSTDKYMRIYFNGVISDSLNIGTFTSNTSTDSLRIGRGYSPYNANSFKGLIDDIRIYDRPLNKKEVDSLYKEHLLVFNRTSKTICQGDSILAGGKYRKITGEYFDTIPLGNKVDSIIVTQLKVNPSYLVPQTITVCSGGKILLGGILRTAAGVYYDSLHTTNGCDSIIKTTLVVNPSYYITRTIPLCNGQSLFVGGANQTSTGTYYDSLFTIKGCDSIVVTTLIINPSYSFQITAEICQGDSIKIAGKYRTLTGIYYDSIISSKNCDSIIITNLIVNPSHYFPTSVNICFGDSVFLGHEYRKISGIYFDTLYTHKGCDSVIATTLAVNKTNDSVQQNLNILIAQETSAAYQWLDCNNSNAPISGETHQSFIASVNGNYAVKITKNNCTAISLCYKVSSLGINSNLKTRVSVYPNPAKDVFTVDLGENYSEIKVSVMSVSGQLLTTHIERNNSSIKIPSDQLAAGVYLLEIVADGKQTVSKIIIE